MDKRKLKHRKLVHPNNPGIIPPGKDSNLNPEINITFPSSSNAAKSMSDHNSESTTLNNSLKRKLETESVFNDFDLSDLKIEKTSHPSFAFTKSFFSFTDGDGELNQTSTKPKAMINDKQEHMAQIESNEHLNFDNYDFDEDLLLLDKSIHRNQDDHSSPSSSLTDLDKNKMMELVKKNLPSNSSAKYPKPYNTVQTQPSPVAVMNQDNESFSDLLDDSSIDDEFEALINGGGLDKSKHDSPPTNPVVDESYDECEFRTASGSSIQPSSRSYAKAKKMFKPIDELLRQEIACYLWHFFENKQPSVGYERENLFD